MSTEKRELSEFEKEKEKNKANFRKKLLSCCDDIQSNFVFYNFTDYRIDGVLLYFCPQQQNYNDINAMFNANYDDLTLKLMKSKFKLRFLAPYVYTYIHDVENIQGYEIYKNIVKKYQDEAIAARTNTETVVENSDIENLLKSVGVDIPDAIKNDKKTFRLLKADVNITMTSEEVIDVLHKAKEEYNTIVAANRIKAYADLILDLTDIGLIRDENFKTLIESVANLVITEAPIPEIANEPAYNEDGEVVHNHRMPEYRPEEPKKIKMEDILKHPDNIKMLKDYIMDFIILNKNNKMLVNNVNTGTDLISLIIKDKNKIINYPIQNLPPQINVALDEEAEDDEIDEPESRQYAYGLGIVAIHDDELILCNSMDFTPPLTFSIFVNSQGMLECKNVKEYYNNDTDGGLTEFLCNAFEINSKLYKNNFNNLMLYIVQNFDTLKLKRFNKLDKILSILNDQENKEKENQTKSWYTNGNNSLNFYYFSIIDITDEVSEVLIHYAATFNKNNNLDNLPLPAEIIEALTSVNIEKMKNHNNKFVSKCNKRVTYNLLSDLGFSFNIEFDKFHEKN